MKIQSQKREMQASEALQRWDGNGFKACWSYLAGRKYLSLLNWYSTTI